MSHYQKKKRQDELLGWAFDDIWADKTYYNAEYLKQGTDRAYSFKYSVVATG